MTEEKNYSLSEMAGICPEITFTADGKNYTISPPTIGHLAEFEKRAKEEKKKKELALIREVADLLTPDDIMMMVQELKKEFTGWIQTLISPDGLRYMMYLRMKDNHPDLTPELVGELVPVSILAEQEMELTELLGMELFLKLPGAEDEAGPPEVVEAEPEIKPVQ